MTKTKTTKENVAAPDGTKKTPKRAAKRYQTFLAKRMVKSLCNRVIVNKDVPKVHDAVMTRVIKDIMHHARFFQHNEGRMGISVRDILGATAFRFPEHISAVEKHYQELKAGQESDV